MGDAGENVTSAEIKRGGLPLERSRFSRLLASFGLGELPNPLLTRGKPHARGSQPGH